MHVCVCLCVCVCGTRASTARVTCACARRPTGAVRVSFGWMSSMEDVRAILTFLKTCFLDSAAGAAANREYPNDQNLHGWGLHKSGGLKSTPAAPRFCSPNCSKASTRGASDYIRQLLSEHVDGRRQPPKGRTAQIACTAHATGFESSPTPIAALMKQARGSTTPVINPHTHAQEVTVQRFSRSAWLQQLCWVRCGDAVTAWPAFEDESQRPQPHSQAATSMGNGAGTFMSSSSQQLPAGRSVDAPVLSVSGQQGPSGGQTGVQPMAPAAPPSRWPTHSVQSTSKSASQSVLQLDRQPALDSQTASGSLQPPTSASQHHSESQHHSDSQACCSQGSLEGIWVYPIKSCGGIRVAEWPLGPNGLLLDREWALVGDDGHVLTQKALPKLALVQPRVDLEQGVMQVFCLNWL